MFFVKTSTHGKVAAGLGVWAWLCLLPAMLLLLSPSSCQADLKHSSLPSTSLSKPSRSHSKTRPSHSKTRPSRSWSSTGSWGPVWPQLPQCTVNVPANKVEECTSYSTCMYQHASTVLYTKTCTRMGHVCCQRPGAVCDTSKGDKCLPVSSPCIPASSGVCPGGQRCCRSQKCGSTAPAGSVQTCESTFSCHWTGTIVQNTVCSTASHVCCQKPVCNTKYGDRCLPDGYLCRTSTSGVCPSGQRCCARATGTCGQHVPSSVKQTCETPGSCQTVNVRADYQCSQNGHVCCERPTGPPSTGCGGSAGARCLPSHIPCTPVSSGTCSAGMKCCGPAKLACDAQVPAGKRHACMDFQQCRAITGAEVLSADRRCAADTVCCRTPGLY